MREVMQFVRGAPFEGQQVIVTQNVAGWTVECPFNRFYSQQESDSENLWT